MHPQVTEYNITVALPTTDFLRNIGTAFLRTQKDSELKGWGSNLHPRVNIAPPGHTNISGILYT